MLPPVVHFVPLCGISRTTRRYTKLFNIKQLLYNRLKIDYHSTSMFIPKYTITEKLLAHIKRINSLILDLNHQYLPNVILLELEKTARAVSAYASTSIEGNPLPLTEVKKILKSAPQNIRNSEKEVLNYNEALKTLSDKIKNKNISLSLELILTIHKQVMLGLLPKYELGKFRQKPVVINNPKTGQVVFLPPDFQDVEILMKNLIDFIHLNKNKIDPLILAGIFHKQMVIIHPFIDGNGRTTRLAVKILLAQMGLNTFNLFSFENYYNNNVTKYFQTVGESGNYYNIKDKVDFTNWLEYFTEGIIDELLRIQKLLPNQKLSPVTQIQVYHQKIIDHIKNNGFITDAIYSKLTKRAKATRTIDFNKLVNMKIIERKGKGRATYYILKEN